ncbi:(R)-amidase [Collimonas sp. OK607]|uniref:carbon-nitrogen hydrolase family protein n=1 Tax=Collimonas sp. OK607 TaxID=1798194 RepID=UPI0008F44BD4|nr:carbon-nitrogen hydrolase family protein [Collimonas sp. OK607]SFB13918.1 (R)-amidase [Collimonas sp. OK607]
MQIELAQVAIVDGALAINLATVLEKISQRCIGTQLMVFPETVFSGFPDADNVAVLAQAVSGEMIAQVCAAARQYEIAVALGFAEVSDDQFFNASVLIDAAGEIVLHHRKVHLWSADTGIFSPGDCFTTAQWNGRQIGLLICFDIEFPESARALASLGAELIIVSDGLMHPHGVVHQRALTARSMENQVFSILVNRCETDAAGESFAGGSMVINPYGDIVLQANNGASTLTAQLDFSAVHESRKEYCYLDQRQVKLAMEEVDIGNQHTQAQRIKKS